MTDSHKPAEDANPADNPAPTANDQPCSETHEEVTGTNGATADQISRWWQIGWDRAVELLFTFAIMGATVVQCSVSNKQWSAMIESNRIANVALTAVQRAFVFADYKIAAARPNNKLDHWRVIFTLENSGATAASPIDLGFIPLENPNVDPVHSEITIVPTVRATYVLGPKAKLTFTEMLIRREAEKLMMAGRRDFILGLAEYRDTLDPDKLHKTKFCFNIFPPPRWDQLDADQTIDIADLSVEMCQHNNCTDDQCSPEDKLPAK